MSNPHYEFEYVTNSEDASESALLGSVYWFESGVTQNGEAAYYDALQAYAYWNNGTEWIISDIGDLGGTVTDYYAQEGSELVGQGTWTGSVTINESAISDAWYRAETTAFESLSSFLGCTEGRDCFRGYEPVQGDSADLKYSNIWQMTSGGSAPFDIERLYVGSNSAWCSLRTDAVIESTWRTREEAMKFAGAVFAWLKSTNNLRETGNVKWVVLTSIPGEPKIYRTAGKNRQRLWKQTIDLELIYKTESEY